MGDGTEKNPYTRKDVLRRIRKNGGTADGLDLSGKTFEAGIDLGGLDLRGIILNKVIFNESYDGKKFLVAALEKTNLWLANLKSAYLRDANLRKANLIAAHLEGADLVGAHLEDADLEGAYLNGTYLNEAYLEGAYLRSANLERACLGEAQFSFSTELDNVEWGNYILGDEKEGSFDQAAATYRRLKQWYQEHGMYDTAAKFYYRQKEANRKQLKLRSKHWNDRVASELMRALFGYGEKWERILIWIAVVIFGLAAAYYFLGSFGSASFWDTLYYSTASFTALGYGQWAPQPTGWAKGMGAAEAIIGVFMMALLLVTFVRKWTR